MDQNHPTALLGQDEPLAPAPESDRGARVSAGRPARRLRRDDWIDARLRSLYDAVAAEPLPPELQAMVDKLLEEPQPPAR
ncbi:hypothetical protein STVA_15600 [Allostella vacuolata]|nr:hypothetical protein STVA_15600 [Stella vacuolata]